MKKSIPVLFCIFLFAAAPLIAQSDDQPGQNQSHYFLIEKEGISADQFPLLSTEVRADITGPVADVVVEQTYKNNGPVAIEASYVFPASTRAAVYALEMVIGNRIIKAEIMEKNAARQEYETARKEGKRASLLEQERSNVFQMKVANIMPGDLIQVVLRYNELIIPENQEYSFVYPTVVGPRFISDKNPGTNESFAANPYFREGEQTPHIFDMEINLNLPVALQSAACSTHKVDIQFSDPFKASARLSADEQHGGNRDFIFNYRVAGREIGSGVVLYEHNDEKFFLATIEPPKLISAGQILPREYIFVIDVSGSMSGFPIETTKILMKNLVGKLKPADLFNVMLFAGGNSVLSPESLPATEENLRTAFGVIDQIQGGGTTEILPALRRICALPKSDPAMSRSVVIVTDGYVTVEPEVFDLISRHLNEVNVFAFGIGSGVNRLLIEGMAHAGRGEAFVVTKPAEASSVAERFRKYIESPVLTGIQVQFSGLDAYEVVPSVIPDLLAERPLYIFGKYRGEAQGSIRFSGYQAGKEFYHKLAVDGGSLSEEHRAIRYLWAREMIRWHHDFNQLSSDPERVNTITRLGLQYNLLTDFTSFVAVDETEIVNPDGLITRVKQVLPLPAGVSNYAVGFEMGAEGVSPVQTVRDVTMIKPVVISSLPVDKKQVLTRLFTENIALWSEDRKQLWKGKILSITFSDKWSEIQITLNGKVVDAATHRMILLMLRQKKEVLEPGMKLVIQF
jgi:Ca-activated chloride channel homolog